MSKKSPARSKLKIVFDTNVYIAALLRPGMAEELVRRGLRGDFTVVVCNEILNELAQKLTGKFNLPQNKIGDFLDLIKSRCDLTKITRQITVLKSDPDDNKILECAYGGKADLIITLDKQLLRLKKYQKIAILHPKTFSWIVPEVK